MIKLIEYEEYSSDLNEVVSSVFFIDDKTGFASGPGIIYKTTNGGINWQSDSITPLRLHSIYFASEDVGFAVGGESGCTGTGCTPPGSIIYKTTDSGETWNKLNIPHAQAELYSVSFFNENVGFAVGLGQHLKTINGGQTWETIEFDYKGMMKKVTFIDSLTVLSAGLVGSIFRSTDLGDSWVQAANESDGHIYDLHFADPNVGYAVGQKEVVKTTDGGKTWKVLPGSPTELYFVYFLNEEDGIAIGRGRILPGDFGGSTRAIFRTRNGGVSWEKEDNVDIWYTNSFYDKHNGYAVTPYKTFRLYFK